MNMVLESQSHLNMAPEYWRWKQWETKGQQEAASQWGQSTWLRHAWIVHLSTGQRWAPNCYKAIYVEGYWSQGQKSNRWAVSKLKQIPVQQKQPLFGLWCAVNRRTFCFVPWPALGLPMAANRHSHQLWQLNTQTHISTHLSHLQMKD